MTQSGSRPAPTDTGHPMALAREQSALVVIDVQERLFPAMDYLRQAGAVVTTTETALFQLLGQADSDAFRELARLIR